MKVWMALAAGLVAVEIAMAAEDELASGPCVAVQILGFNLVAAPVLIAAQQNTSRLFREVGVAVYWHEDTSRRSAPACTKVVAEFRQDFSHSDATALAMAWPYKRGGTRIQIFLSRTMMGRSPKQNGTMLGYVIAHEIGHVAEGIGRHSDSGVLKAHWSKKDYNQIIGQSLRFTDTDAELIRLGLGKTELASAALR